MTAHVHPDQGGPAMTDVDDQTITEARVRAALAELPDLCARLARGEVDGPERAARSSSRPPNERSVTNLAVLDALDRRRKYHGDVTDCDPNRLGILPTLDGWAVLLEADMLDRSPAPPIDLPSPPTVPGVCDWLDEHLHWWVGKPEWDEFAADVTRQHNRAKALVGGGRDEVQHCLGVGGCGGVVERVGESALYRCRSCGKERSLTSVMDVTLPQAAAMVAVPERTLRSWAARYLIQPLDPTVGERQRRYDINEIRRVKDERAERSA